MHRTLLFSLILSICGASFTSCTKYDIQGTSDINDVDNHMLFLKEVVADNITNIDSCDVLHGKFKFSGTLDSVRIVMLCIDNQPVLPVVLEDGPIKVILNTQGQSCNGTPLNDTLNVFNTRYQQLIAQIGDLEHQQNQAIMNGEDMEVANERISALGQKLLMQEDKLITDFITTNFDNCLGPYVFQMATSSFEAPMLTPWIEALMTKATDKFKEDVYVKEYMEKARYNQDIMTGVASPETAGNQQQAPAHAPAGNPMMPALDQAPTPNEMAAGDK